MSRAHAWIGLAAGLALLLPAGGAGTDDAADAGVPAVLPAPMALPSPAASRPRLGFVDATDRIVGVALKVPDPPREPPGPRVKVAAAPPAAPPPPIWDESATVDPFDFPDRPGRDGEASVRFFGNDPPVGSDAFVRTDGAADAGDVFVGSGLLPDVGDDVDVRVLRQAAVVGIERPIP